MSYTFNNEVWPDTGRVIPANVQLEIRYVHDKWRDLCWYDAKRDCFVYISTLPKI
jgi:hypothetical protein